jgi:hypothetical protein
VLDGKIRMQVSQKLMHMKNYNENCTPPIVNLQASAQQIHLSMSAAMRKASATSIAPFLPALQQRCDGIYESMVLQYGIAAVDEPRLFKYANALIEAVEITLRSYTSLDPVTCAQRSYKTCDAPDSLQERSGWQETA